MDDINRREILSPTKRLDATFKPSSSSLDSDLKTSCSSSLDSTWKSPCTSGSGSESSWLPSTPTKDLTWRFSHHSNIDTSTVRGKEETTDIKEKPGKASSKMERKIELLDSCLLLIRFHSHLFQFVSFLLSYAQL